MSAEEVRTYVQSQYIEPSRKRGRKEITIRAGDIHDELGYKNLQPLVCDTLSSKKLQELCKIELVEEQWGKHVHQRHAKNIWYTYQLVSKPLLIARLDSMNPPTCQHSAKG